MSEDSRTKMSGLALRKQLLKISYLTKLSPHAVQTKFTETILKNQKKYESWIKYLQPQMNKDFQEPFFVEGGKGTVKTTLIQPLYKI